MGDCQYSRRPSNDVSKDGIEHQLPRTLDEYLFDVFRPDLAATAIFKQFAMLALRC